MYLGQHLCILVSISVKLRDDWKIFCYWLEDILLWLEDRLEDIQFSSLSSSLYSVKSQRVAPILGDMADFFAYRVIMHVTASLLSVRSMKFSPMNANVVFFLVPSASLVWSFLAWLSSFRSMFTTIGRSNLMFPTWLVEFILETTNPLIIGISTENQWVCLFCCQF